MMMFELQKMKNRYLMMKEILEKRWIGFYFINFPQFFYRVFVCF